MAHAPALAPARAGAADAAAPRRPLASDRLAALPPFLFDEIDRMKRRRIAAGADVINLGVGDPDKPTPGFIVEAMNAAMRELGNQQYPAVGGGLRVFREAAARFMQARFGVRVDPQRHVLALMGSKDGIAHLPWAVTNPGDVVCVPDPAYPVYEIGAVLAGARVHKMPASPESGWAPEPAEIPGTIARAARLLWVNFPSNPTAASAPPGLYERVLGWARPRGVIVASDLAYSEVYLEGPEARPPSLWEAPGADPDTTLAIEFHSLSKTFNMTGWRIGFAVGHPEVIAALQAVKSNVDSGTFNAIQAAGAVALDSFDHADVRAMRALYRARRDAVVPGLRAAGCEVRQPDAGFFVWARTPRGADGTPVPSLEFAARLLEEGDTVVVPGGGFGPRGEPYFRVALTVEADRLAEAARRIAAIDWTSPRPRARD
ncbi:MAG TPA: aminotransferase class I/II-fold pyridoxal phosphate-dependent enzyme [Phycisphaerales bacterium]|nr:aminotransferase class I/II-fold pyridoxal phosphate-dependent enzyme [Phycisphaerales bacterium]